MLVVHYVWYCISGMELFEVATIRCNYSGALRTGSRLKKKNVTGLLLLPECTFVWNRNIFFGMPKEHKKIFLAPPMKYNVGVATSSQ